MQLVKPKLSPSELAEQFYAFGYRALVDGQGEIAARYFAFQLLANPNDERAWIGLGSAQEQLGKPIHAAAAYRLGAAHGASSAWCQLGLGRVLRRLGRAREAERAFDEAERAAHQPEQLALIERAREEEPCE